MMPRRDAVREKAAMEVAVKEKDREREKENADRNREKEQEREGDVEAALYANCLLLGLDPTVPGPGAGMRAGLFRHSSPCLGEALLMCALRGPSLSAKDFAGVWPIFDAAQSPDFCKVAATQMHRVCGYQVTLSTRRVTPAT